MRQQGTTNGFVRQQAPEATADAVSWTALDERQPPPPPAVLAHGPALAPEHANSVSLAAKRAIDIAGALLGLVLLSPLWLLIGVLIRLDTPGPALFRQRRVGRGGEIFHMCKFRTMIRDADSKKLHVLHLNEAGEGLFKISGDPRVTRFGRFLRSTSLDEIPQLIHVLTGRMSLIGPRPLIPEEDALIEGPQRARLQMRPGMTGAWQVAGASQIPIDEMGRLDADYVANWSLLGDIKLLAGTLPHVVLRRGI
jgi:lipopolysaccharide/colanic/teichoic acid biosynthesis glycosyltransferase